MQNDADKIIDNDWLHNTPTLSIKTSHVVHNGAHHFCVCKTLLILGSLRSTFHLKRRKSKLVWSTLLFEIIGLAVLLCSFYTRALEFRFRVQVSTFCLQFYSCWVAVDCCSWAETAENVFVALSADFMKDTIHQVDQQLFTLSAFPCHCQISTSILEYLV